MTSTFEVTSTPDKADRPGRRQEKAPEFATAAPERPSSAVALLKSRRAAIRDSLYVDLKVPRYDKGIEVFVRYGPIDNTRTEKAIEARINTKADEVNVLANADILVNSCIGVFACLDGDYDTRLSLNVDNENGPWTRFDPDLATVLDVRPDNAGKAVEVCRALYYTDGDLINAANALVEWSAQASEKLDKDFSTP